MKLYMFNYDEILNTYLKNKYDNKVYKVFKVQHMFSGATFFIEDIITGKIELILESELSVFENLGSNLETINILYK